MCSLFYSKISNIAGLLSTFEMENDRTGKKVHMIFCGEVVLYRIGDEWAQIVFLL